MKGHILEKATIERMLEQKESKRETEGLTGKGQSQELRLWTLTDLAKIPSCLYEPRELGQGVLHQS